jgi:hypothetical protein
MRSCCCSTRPALAGHSAEREQSRVNGRGPGRETFDLRGESHPARRVRDALDPHFVPAQLDRHHVDGPTKRLSDRHRSLEGPAVAGTSGFRAPRAPAREGRNRDGGSTAGPRRRSPLGRHGLVKRPARPPCAARCRARRWARRRGCRAWRSDRPARCGCGRPRGSRSTGSASSPIRCPRPGPARRCRLERGRRATAAVGSG